VKPTPGHRQDSRSQAHDPHSQTKEQWKRLLPATNAVCQGGTGPGGLTTQHPQRSWSKHNGLVWKVLMSSGGVWGSGLFLYGVRWCTMPNHNQILMKYSLSLQFSSRQCYEGKCSRTILHGQIIINIDPKLFFFSLSHNLWQYILYIWFLHKRTINIMDSYQFD
jgi:hypothetical protein